MIPFSHKMKKRYFSVCYMAILNIFSTSFLSALFIYEEIKKRRWKKKIAKLTHAIFSLSYKYQHIKNGVWLIALTQIMIFTTKKKMTHFLTVEQSTIFFSVRQKKNKTVWLYFMCQSLISVHYHFNGSMC